MAQDDDYIDAEVIQKATAGANSQERPNMGCLMAFLPFLVIFLLVFGPIYLWNQCRIDVPSRHMAILIKKIGGGSSQRSRACPEQMNTRAFKSRSPSAKAATSNRLVYNPYFYDWIVVPQIEIPEGKLGVRIRLHGDNLAPGDLIAFDENQKGYRSRCPHVPARYARSTHGSLAPKSVVTTAMPSTSNCTIPSPFPPVSKEWSPTFRAPCLRTRTCCWFRRAGVASRRPHWNRVLTTSIPT